MQIVRSPNGVPIRLTEERWSHIVASHPEMVSQIARVLETVQAPELVQEGDFGALLALRHYESTPLSSKFLVVAFREVAGHDGFILTAYLARRPSSRRRVLWRS